MPCQARYQLCASPSRHPAGRLMPLTLQISEHGTMALRCKNKIRSANKNYYLYKPTQAGRTRGNTPEAHNRLMPKSPPIKSDWKNTSSARSTIPAPKKHSPMAALLKPRLTQTRRAQKFLVRGHVAIGRMENATARTSSCEVSLPLPNLAIGAIQATGRVSKMSLRQQLLVATSRTN